MPFGEFSERPVVLRVESLSRRFEGSTQAALHDISFSLAEASQTIVLGASGSGKSTLLRLIYGLERADSGAVYFRNERVKGPDQQLVPGHKKMALAWQQFGLSPTMNVYDNISLPLIAHPITEQKKKVAELMKLCALGDVARKLPRELSGGEQQRVGLAKALAGNAELLLLDESFSQLDVPIRRNLQRQLQEKIAREGKTALLVSHDPFHALAAADDLMILEAGRLVQRGSPREVYSKPVSLYVARLFGEVSQVSPQTWKLLGGKADHKTQLTRPEQLRLSQASDNGYGLVVRVRQYWFQGDRFLVEAESVTQAELLYFYHNQAVASGTEACLCMAEV